MRVAGSSEFRTGRNWARAPLYLNKPPACINRNEDEAMRKD